MRARRYDKYKNEFLQNVSYLEDKTKHRIINMELLFFIRHLTYFKIIFRTGSTGELVMFPK